MTWRFAQRFNLLLLYQLTQKHFCHLQVSTEFLKLLCISNEETKELIQFPDFPNMSI